MWTLLTPRLAFSLSQGIGLRTTAVSAVRNVGAGTKSTGIPPGKRTAGNENAMGQPALPTTGAPRTTGSITHAGMESVATQTGMPDTNIFDLWYSIKVPGG